MLKLRIYIVNGVFQASFCVLHTIGITNFGIYKLFFLILIFLSCIHRYGLNHQERLGVFTALIYNDRINQ